LPVGCSPTETWLKEPDLLDDVRRSYPAPLNLRRR